MKYFTMLPLYRILLACNCHLVTALLGTVSCRLGQTLRMVPLTVPQRSWNQMEADSRSLRKCHSVMYRGKLHAALLLFTNRCCLVANSPDWSHNGPTKCGCQHTWFIIAVPWKMTCLEAVDVPERAEMAYHDVNTVSSPWFLMVQP
jgi:hypothetical protein